MADEQKNLAIWNKVETTPLQFAKEFNKGRFKGTSVNPIFNAERATKLFGPAGIGWGVRSLQTKVHQLDEDTVMCAEEVQLWYIWDGKEGSVSHWGSEMLMQRVGKKKDGGGYISHDDEAWKKCRTNATSKCFSLLGFSADLWKGYYESKAYKQKREKEMERDNVAMDLKERFRAIEQTLENKCLCQSDADKETVCQWVMDNPDITLGAMQIVPGMSDQVKEAMAEAKESGTEPHQMLAEAKKWKASFTEP